MKDALVDHCSPDRKSKRVENKEKEEDEAEQKQNVERDTRQRKKHHRRRRNMMKKRKKHEDECENRAQIKSGHFYFPALGHWPVSENNLADFSSIWIQSRSSLYLLPSRKESKKKYSDY